MSNILKCKMCGGDITINNDKTHGTCDFCGSVMTFPKVDDEQRLATFNRGNQFRRAGEFDKAILLYEQLIRDDDKDAEAHWCCALSRFGIEYVEDPTTLEYIPTCHRASIDSFLEDVDYLAAVKYSDGITQKQYQKDAMKIAEVQRGILATSQNEEPFDIFICYKESDANGDRTIDSSLAQDIYYQLTDVGYKVFFSRITLEDKVGSEYEPYIFAALNSAKVMVVVGTSKENLDAVWVKNEWSRYLSIMRKDRKRVILPCYRDMDPYDMPEALSVLQSYDMSKIGFIQDLVRGIKKVVDAEQSNQISKETVVGQQNVTTSNGNDIENSIKRAKLALEDKKWDEAKKFCERILDSDAENGHAYLLLFMAAEKVASFAEVAAIKSDIDKDKDFAKAVRYSKGEVAEKIQEILDTRTELFNQQAYSEASKYLKGFHPFKKKKAAITFEKLGNYRDSSVLMKKVGESARKDNRVLAIFLCLVFVLSIGSGAFIKYALPEIKYKKAVTYFENAQYTEAEATFLSLSEYKDSENLKEKAHIFDVSTDTNKEKEFLDLELSSLNVDEDTQKVIAECIIRLISEKKVEQAELALDKFGKFEPVQAVSDDLAVEKINQLLEENKIDEAIAEIANVSESFSGKQELYDKCNYFKAKTVADVIEMVSYAIEANGYADSEEIINDNATEALKKCLESGNLKVASKLFEYDVQLDNLEQLKKLCEEYEKYDVDVFVKKQGVFREDTTISIMPKVDLSSLAVKIVVSGFQKAGAEYFDGNVLWKCNGDRIETDYHGTRSDGYVDFDIKINGFIDVETGNVNVKYHKDKGYKFGSTVDSNFVAQGEILD